MACSSARSKVACYADTALSGGVAEWSHGMMMIIMMMRTIAVMPMYLDKESGVQTNQTTWERP